MNDPSEHGPIEEKYANGMRNLATLLDEYFNEGAKGKDRKIGFFLAMFEFDNSGEREDQGRFNYISNADRMDVKAMLKDIVARIEERERLEAHSGSGD